MVSAGSVVEYVVVSSAGSAVERFLAFIADFQGRFLFRFVVVGNDRGTDVAVARAPLVVVVVVVVVVEVVVVAAAAAVAVVVVVVVAVAASAVVCDVAEVVVDFPQ